LSARLDEIPRSRWHEPGVWGDGWTVTDLVAHLAEWQAMFLMWYDAGLEGLKPAMPAPGYKWNETPKLNQVIWARNRFRPAFDVKTDFDAGFNRILEIVETLTPERLLEPGYFPWTGKNSLATYVCPNTASHYRFALKVIERWLKGGAMRTVSVARNKQERPATPPRIVRALPTRSAVT
jgi:hypothetical protein